ncbi:uncharacterized protein V6R79_013110 [Siganus canaliculatus]
MPQIEDDINLPRRPTTRADTQKRQRKIVQPSIHEQEDTDLSSDSSSEYCVQRPHRTYKTYLERLLQERAAMNVPDSEEEGPALVREEYVEEERNGQEEDEDQRQGSDAEEETGSESGSDSDGEPVSEPDVAEIPEPRVRPKRRVQPVVRLTYDGLGKGGTKEKTTVRLFIRRRFDGGLFVWWRTVSSDGRT